MTHLNLKGPHVLHNSLLILTASVTLSLMKTNYHINQFNYQPI